MEKTEENRCLPGIKQIHRICRACCIALLALLCLSAPARAEEYYICAGGESPGEIAEWTGVSEELLLAANGLDGTEELQPGQLLRLPSELLLTATVEAGDTLYALAESYGVTVAQIQAYNPVRPDRLRVGMQLHIPLGEEVAAIADSRQAIPALSSLSYRSERLSYPVEGIISSRFGSRWGSFHYGLDLAADQGIVVTAAASGLVTEADWKNNAYGYAVMIDHGNAMETLYGHCSELLVEEGQQVRAGDAIALVGSTGNSTGPHVHFEVRINGECQDPLDYL